MSENVEPKLHVIDSVEKWAHPPTQIGEQLVTVDGKVFIATTDDKDGWAEVTPDPEHFVAGTHFGYFEEIDATEDFGLKTPTEDVAEPSPHMDRLIQEVGLNKAIALVVESNHSYFNDVVMQRSSDKNFNVYTTEHNLQCSMALEGVDNPVSGVLTTGHRFIPIGLTSTANSKVVLRPDGMIKWEVSFDGKEREVISASVDLEAAIKDMYNLADLFVKNIDDDMARIALKEINIALDEVLKEKEEQMQEFYGARYGRFA